MRAFISPALAWLPHLPSCAARSLPSMRSLLLALASDAPPLKHDTSGWSFAGETAEEARVALSALLQLHHVRLSDLFQQLDGDGSLSLSVAELRDAFRQLGFSGEGHVIDGIFTAIDHDDSGKVGFDEFSAWLQGRTMAPKHASDVAAALSLVPRIESSHAAGDEPWRASRLRQELLHLLTGAQLRCVDLLRAMDRDESGKEGERARSRRGGDQTVSSKEWMLALKRLCGGGGAGAGGGGAGDTGVESHGGDGAGPKLSSDELWYGMTRDAAREAFGKMDKSGDRAVTIVELQRWLDPHATLMAQRSGSQSTRLQSIEAHLSSASLQSSASLPALTKAARAASASSSVVSFADSFWEETLSPPSCQGVGSFSDEASIDSGGSYSPTPLSKRLAAVRSFIEPVTDEASRHRPASRQRPKSSRNRPTGTVASPLTPIRAPNAVRERVWSSRTGETVYKLGPSSMATCPPGFKVMWKR